jgi:four helix bundle protein
MGEFNFEKLQAWQESKCFAARIYKISEQFPKHELFGLTNQLRRAAVSVCLNLAEGASRQSSKEQAHFYKISYGSLMEAISALVIANELSYIDSVQLSNLRKETNYLATMINGLHKSALRRS